MRRIPVLIFLFTVLTVQAQISLAPGAKMPNVNAEWIIQLPSGGKPLLPGKEWKDFRILTFADAYSPDFLQTLRLMESVERRYGKPGKDYSVTVQTVTKNDAADLKRVIGNQTAPFQLNLGADKEGKTFRTFAPGVASLPYTFISRNGAIVWSGHPVEIETVMDALLADQFSLDTQRKIAGHRRELQSALRAGLPDVVSQTADKILALSPRDSIAMQAKLYSFQLKGRSAEAIRFLEEFIRKNPENSMQTRMMLLNLLLQQPNPDAAWEKAVAETSQYAMQRPEDSLNLATYLLRNTAMERPPVQAALKLAENAEKLFRATRDNRYLADALETLARANYAACRLDKAIQAQQEAVRIRETEKSPLLPSARRMLSFYEKLKTL